MQQERVSQWQVLGLQDRDSGSDLLHQQLQQYSQVVLCQANCHEGHQQQPVRRGFLHLNCKHQVDQSA